MTTAIDRICAEHARCLTGYLKAKQTTEDALHWHGQLHGLEFAASCLDNDLGDALIRSRHLIDQLATADLTSVIAERRLESADAANEGRLLGGAA
jgi:hypothetical protein